MSRLTQAYWLLSCWLLSLGLGACGPALSQAYRQQRAAALRAHSHGRYGEAASHWQRAAQAASSQRHGYEALYRAAASLRRAGRHPEARRLLQRLQREAPRHARAARAAYELAEISLHGGQRQRGLKQLQAFLHAYPNSGLAPSALRRVLEATLSAHGGEAVLRYLRRQTPQLEQTELGEHLHYAAARQLARLGRRHDALKRYLQLAGQFPYPSGTLWDDALWNASLLEEELGRPQRAVAHLERLLKEREPSAFAGSYERPRYSAARYRIAELYRDRLGAPQRARRAFRTLWDQHPTSLLRDDAAWQEARLSHTAGDTQGACGALRRLSTEHPESRFVPCAPLLCPSVKKPKGKPRPCRAYIQRQLR